MDRLFWPSLLFLIPLEAVIQSSRPEEDELASWLDVLSKMESYAFEVTTESSGGRQGRDDGGPTVVSGRFARGFPLQLETRGTLEAFRVGENLVYRNDQGEWTLYEPSFGRGRGGGGRGDGGNRGGGGGGGRGSGLNDVVRTRPPHEILEDIASELRDTRSTQSGDEIIFHATLTPDGASRIANKLSGGFGRRGESQYEGSLELVPNSSQDLSRIVIETIMRGTFDSRPFERTQHVEIVLRDIDRTEVELPSEVLETIARAAQRLVDLVTTLGQELDAETLDLEAVTKTVESLRSAFTLPEIDPAVEENAVDRVMTVAKGSLEGGSEVTPSTFGVSSEARLFVAAVAFLQDRRDSASFEFLLECLTNPLAVDWLGIDGLQGVRSRQQRNRSSMTPEMRETTDRFYRDVLVAAGHRIFALEEEPMDTSEKTAFFKSRHLRYNALSWFCDQWGRVEEVRGIWLEDPEAIDALTTLALAREDRTIGEGVDTLSSAVEERAESRILAIELLSLIAKDMAVSPSTDLFHETLTILADEVGGRSRIEAALAMRIVFGGLPTIEVKEARVPDDTYVRDRAIRMIRSLGYDVEVDNENRTIRITSKEPANG